MRFPVVPGLLVPLLLLAAPAAAAPDVRTLLIEAARQSGCRMTEDQAEALFTPLGIGKGDVGSVAQAMLAAGEASLDGKDLLLSPQLCAATGAPPAPAMSAKMAAVVAVFNANGCLLTDANVLPLLAEAGVTEADIEAMEPEIGAMLETGLLTELDDAAKTVRLEPPLCTAGMTPAADPDEPLIRMLAENGCRLTQNAAGPLLPAYGLTMKTADAMADSLMDRGLAQAEGEELVLKDCAG